MREDGKGRGDARVGGLRVDEMEREVKGRWVGDEFLGEREGRSAWTE